MKTEKTNLNQKLETAKKETNEQVIEQKTHKPFFLDDHGNFLATVNGVEY